MQTVAIIYMGKAGRECLNGFKRSKTAAFPYKDVLGTIIIATDSNAIIAKGGTHDNFGGSRLDSLQSIPAGKGWRTLVDGISEGTKECLDNGAIFGFGGFNFQAKAIQSFAVDNQSSSGHHACRQSPKSSHFDARDEVASLTGRTKINLLVRGSNLFDGCWNTIRNGEYLIGIGRIGLSKGPEEWTGSGLIFGGI